MIFLKRKRLVFWLLKAYAKRWRRTIFVSFLIGILVFFLIRYGLNYFIPLLPFINEQKIGIEGAYTVDNLPQTILSKVSGGLTKLDDHYNVLPNVSNSWEIRDGGKTYIFYLKKDIYFSDKSKLVSDSVNYNFSDVSIQRPNESTIVFRLKSKYSPFLVTVSRPIFKKGFIGLGEFKVVSINLNGDFVQSISLRSIKNPSSVLIYQFYPTQESLKTAFVLGEIKTAIGLSNMEFNNNSLDKFPNVEVSKTVNDQELITLFYNTLDKDLSDKRLREAIGYAMPDDLSLGQRNYGPFSPKSWVVEDGLTSYSQDIDHAKLLLSQSDSFKGNKRLEFELKTYRKYILLANIIKSNLEKIGLKIKVTVVDSFPDSFQMFLGNYMVPKDPDQYMLWHSGQTENITGYKNLRIDKLLEDGRQTIDNSERKKIYSDFQKYLLDDPPATFLLFPFSYKVTRK